MDKQAKWITEAVEAIAETAVKEDGEYWRGTYTREDDNAVALLKKNTWSLRVWRSILMQWEISLAVLLAIVKK